MKRGRGRLTASVESRENPFLSFLLSFPLAGRTAVPSEVPETGPRAPKEMERQGGNVARVG